MHSSRIYKHFLDLGLIQLRTGDFVGLGYGELYELEVLFGPVFIWQCTYVTISFGVL